MQTIFAAKIEPDARRRKVNFFFFTLFFSITGFFGFSDAEAGLDLAYTFKTVDPANAIAEITINIKNIETSELEVTESFWATKDYIQTFSVKNKNNKDLPYTTASYAGPFYSNPIVDYWIIQCNGVSEININYRLKVGFEVPNAYLWGRPVRYGYLGPDFGLVSGGMIFLLPTKSAINSITVSFDLPPSWEIHVPWELINPLAKTYVIRPNNDGLDHALDAASFAFGTVFNKYEYKIGGTVMRVALHRGFSTKVRETLAGRAKRIMEHFTSVFDGSVGDYFLLILIPPLPDPDPKGLSIILAEYINSIADTPYISADEDRIDLSKVAHETFHRWNGTSLGFSGGGAWWADGLAEYYSKKATIRADGYSWIEAIILNIYNELQEKYVKMGDDRALAYVIRWSGDVDTEVFFIYQKSHLVTFLLAKEMYMRTNGAYKLDDLMTVLFQKYKNLNGYCDEPCLQAEIEAITGHDFTQFFNDFVYGIAPLPMAWAMKDNDGDGLSNLAEIYFDTHPGKSDTDRDGYSDFEEVTKGTDPLSRRSCPGPCPPAIMPWIDILLF